MKDLRYYLAELCGITLHCDFRFTGSAAPLPSATMWQWYDLACALINHARAANEDARLTVQLLQAPCLFSLSVYADNDSFRKYLDEYPTDILMKRAELDITRSDIQIHGNGDGEGGSGIAMYASYN